MLIFGGGEGRGQEVDRLYSVGGGLMQKKESPGFRFPEVGISAVATVNSRLLLVKSSVVQSFFCT